MKVLCSIALFFLMNPALSRAEGGDHPSVNLRVNNSEEVSQIAQVGNLISLEWASSRVDSCSIALIGDKSGYLFFSIELSGIETIQLPWVSDRISVRVLCASGMGRVSDEIVVVTYY